MMILRTFVFVFSYAVLGSLSTLRNTKLGTIITSTTFYRSMSFGCTSYLVYEVGADCEATHNTLFYQAPEKAIP